MFSYVLLAVCYLDANAAVTSQQNLFTVGSEHNMKHPLELSSLYHKMKGVMHYKPSLEEMDQWKPFQVHSDSGDVKTVSRFDSYQLNVPSVLATFDEQAIHQKGTVKDKRFIMNTVKPVYEVIENDTTDRPVAVPFVGRAQVPKRYAHPPRYHHKHEDSEDDFYFNNLFADNETPTEGIETARSEIKTFPVIKDGGLPDEPEPQSNIEFPKELSTNRNGEYNRGKEEFNHYDRGHGEVDFEKDIKENAGNKYTGGQQLKDLYEKRYGQEDLKRLSKHSAKKLRDNAERMVGFHKIHHKDEYQMEKQFHDNVANMEHGEDIEESKRHQTGEAGLSAQDIAAIVNQDANSYYNGRNHFRNDYNNYRNIGDSRYSTDSYELLPMGFYDRIPD